MEVQRYGVNSPQNFTTLQSGLIDNLTMTYYPGTNKLQSVADNGHSDFKHLGFNQLAGSGSTANVYDASGNITYDHTKFTTITYNHLNLPSAITFANGNKIENLYTASGTKLRTIRSTNNIAIETQHYVGGIEYKESGGNYRLEAIYHPEGRVYNTNITDLNNAAINLRYEYCIKDHLGNTRVTFSDKNGNGQLEVPSEILQENHYYPFGMNMGGPWMNDATATDKPYQYNGKELESFGGLGWMDFGARWYDAGIGRWGQVDPMADKMPGYSPYNYGNNNPIIMIDPSGNYAISVHYKITYDAFIKAGYSKKEADLYAHYSSTYSDHPAGWIMVLDANLKGRTRTPHLMYRNDHIDYSATEESQDEKNSDWHAMRSNAEAAGGMTRDQAYTRGLEFGWNSIFESIYDGGTDLGRLGQGIHALQDAIAHRGASTNQHLGKNVSTLRMFYNDLYGSQKEAAVLTKTAIAVVSVLQGKKSKIKDGDKLDERGMSREQMNTFINKLSSSGFTGTINFY